ncbi:MAG: tyrosine-type recombinase/integrase [Kiritimatiellae bacterium]|nr:tyrosine-type recombinase/integrase [Kiritimatiellia bacterium]
MNIYKRGNVWWVRWYARGNVHRQSTHSRDYKVAKKWLEQIKVARHMPTFEEAVEVLRMLYKNTEEGIKIENAWDEYIKLAEVTGKAALSKSTLYSRALNVRRFVEWIRRDRPAIKTVAAVTGPVAASYAAYIATQKLKSKTRINIIADLSTVWKMLEKASAEVHNPWHNLQPRNIDGERGKSFTPEDEQKVLEAARRIGKDWYPICVLMRHTGLRYGDVSRLEWQNIDGETLRVRPHKTTRHGIEVALPIIAPLREIIDTIPKRGDYLFPMHAELYENRGKRNHALVFAEVLAAAGLADAGYTIHSWRHTAATRLAGAGVDIETRKRILGHTVDETARRYDHDEHLAETRAALESAAK